MTSDAARPVKTSATHPLEILVVEAPGGGRIGMMLCPGKRQPEAVTGPWDRDLNMDLDAVRTFGAAMVLTLMETDELVAAAVPAEMMAAAVRARGMDWLHLPISDFAAPSADFEAAWRTHGPRVRAAVQTGKSVAIHCRGGRGRSGMIAARILVELGSDPEAAIVRVRAANSLAIETPVQEAHVRACRRLQG